MGIVGSTDRGTRYPPFPSSSFSPTVSLAGHHATGLDRQARQGCMFVATWLRPMPRDQRPYLPIEKETIVVAVSSQSKRHTSRE
jgi:hypothetical protein